jgi:hypothetical protein
MTIHQLLQSIANFFESEGIPYRVVGSMATIAYGEIRLTRDIDVLAAITPAVIPRICAAFAMPDFYVSEAAVRDALKRRSQFNIIHLSSGIKVDVIVPADEPFSRSEMSRGDKLITPGAYAAWFASPEDTILSKLVYYKMGESEKHLRDIAGVLRVQGERIDRAYIEHWAAQLEVVDEWRLVSDERNWREV